jgi:transcriptional regulator with XRE-family HTH domain
MRRAELGMKRKDLARESGLSYPYVSEIENGLKEPSARALRMLAQALDLTSVSLLDLVDRLEEPGQRSILVDIVAGTTNSTWTQERAGDVREPTPALAGSAPSPLEEWLTSEVQAQIRAELNKWARTELPRLIRTELQRALEDEPEV